MFERSAPAPAVRLLLALSAVVIFLFCVGSAAAAPINWYTGTTATNGTVLGAKEPLSATLSSENFQEFKTGTPGWKGIHIVLPFYKNTLVIETSGAECVGCSIENAESAGAVVRGKLRFTGGKVTGYYHGCQVGSEGKLGTLTTKELKMTAGSNSLSFVSMAGVLGTFLQVEVGTCGAASGLYNFQGSTSAEVRKEALGVASKSHWINFSPESGGLGSGSEGWGGHLEGTLVASLPSGKYWYAK